MAQIKGMFTGGATWPDMKWIVTDSMPAAQPPADGFPVQELEDVAFLQFTSGVQLPSEPRTCHRVPLLSLMCKARI